MFKQLLIFWHTYRLHYYKALMEGCLNEQIREKIIISIGYHSNRINRLNQLTQAPRSLSTIQSD